MSVTPVLGNALVVTSLSLLVSCESALQGHGSLYWPRGAASWAWLTVPGPAVRSPIREELELLAREAAAREELDPLLVLAVIDVESGWDPRAVSRKGARGLMQIMPATARDRFDLRDPSRLLDPRLNLELGTRLLRNLLDAFCGDLRQALWAYHAGEGRVDRTWEQIGPPESRDYVEKVLARYEARARRNLVFPRDFYHQVATGGPGCEDGAGAVGVGKVESSRARSGPAARTVPPPVPRITNAYFSSLTVRVGEPLDLKVVGINEEEGGPSPGGILSVSLHEHPRLRIGYRSDLPVRAYVPGEPYRTMVSQIVRLEDPLIEVDTSGWAPGEEHWLYARLIPFEAGEIVLSYRLLLWDNQGEGRVLSYPSRSSFTDPLGWPASRVAIRVVR